MVTQTAPSALPRAVRGLLALWGRAPGDPLLAVDERDEMVAFLRVLHDDDPAQALADYFRTGREIADVLLQVLRWRFGPACGERAVLDFASGWGRVTRFLVGEFAPERLWVSDVLPDAVAFQRAAFGVHGAVSSVRPEDLALGATYDAITVTSLFTHLPEERFRDWLAALWRLLRPGGVLLFSTHDSALHPEEGLRGRRFLFETASESRELALEDYGTAWVDEAFVREALAAACPGSSARRLRRALCGFQDLWVVIPEAEASLSSLAVQSAPELMVEHASVQGGELSLRGWAMARHGGVAAVELLAEGEVVAAAPLAEPRPDVAAALGLTDAAAGAPRGWSCRCRLPGGDGGREAILALRAIDARGVAHVVRAGALDALLAAFRARQVHALAAAAHAARCDLAASRAEAEDRRRRDAAELEGLRARLAAMEASRFWKLRNAWFAIKRALGLTDER